MPGKQNQANMRRLYDQMKRPSPWPFIFAVVASLAVAGSVYWGLWELATRAYG